MTHFVTSHFPSCFWQQWRTHRTSALGTLVLQGAQDKDLRKYYGAFWTDSVIKRLFLDDLFGSMWYHGLLALLALAMLLVVLRRPFWRVWHWGFVLTHGGL